MNESWIEKIEDYLHGKMSHEERALFELELSNNEELSATLDLYRMIDTEMGLQQRHIEGETALKQSLEELNKEYFHIEAQQPNPVLGVQREISSNGQDKSQIAKGKVKKMPVFRTLAVAAAVLGIIVISVTWFILRDSRSSDKKMVGNNKSDTLKKTTFPSSGDVAKNDTGSSETKIISRPLPDSSSGLEGLVPGLAAMQSKGGKVKHRELFAANYHPDTSTAPASDIYESAIENYERKEYGSAIAQINNFREMMDSETRGEGGKQKAGLEGTAKKQQLFYNYYYMGLSYLALDSITRAIPELSKASNNSPDKTWKAKAKWYLALAYLRSGNTEKAKNLFNELATKYPASGYTSKAKDIFNELNQ